MPIIKVNQYVYDELKKLKKPPNTFGDVIETLMFWHNLEGGKLHRAPKRLRKAR